MIIQVNMLGGLSMSSPIINQYIKRPTWELKNIERALSSPISMGLLNTREDFDTLSAVRWVLRSRKKWSNNNKVKTAWNKKQKLTLLFQ